MDWIQNWRFKLGYIAGILAFIHLVINEIIEWKKNINISREGFKDASEINKRTKDNGNS